MTHTFPSPRRLVVGDVHGCLEELHTLLWDKVHFRPGYDALHFVGDLVDRGPDSSGVVSYIQDLYSRFYKVIAVQGNHDDRYVRYFRHEQRRTTNPHHKNPMFLNTEKMGVYSSLSESNLKFLSSLQTIATIQGGTEPCWILVHAGLQPNVAIQNQDLDQVKHIRYVDKNTMIPKGLTKDYKQPPNTMHWTEFYDLPYNVICGHHVHSFQTPKVIERPNGTKIVCVDTGCAYGGYLTAYDIDSGEFWQVKPAKQYSEAYE